MYVQAIIIPLNNNHRRPSLVLSCKGGYFEGKNSVPILVYSIVGLWGYGGNLTMAIIIMSSQDRNPTSLVD
jgi:hypothetical protein